MLDIHTLRTADLKVITMGSHPSIIQSILDFDYISGKTKPSIQVILASGRKFERYFFGKRELLIPIYSSVQEIPKTTQKILNFFLNLSSSRRALKGTVELLDHVPSLVGGVIFAEDVPEKHALELYEYAKKNNKFIIGPASVGLLLPNILKLGAIGGTDYRQLLSAQLFTPGNVAVFSASGGMTNEIINIVTKNGKRVSFALHFGGDRFPIISPEEAFLMAEQDVETKTIVYYGELGGYDEYKIADLLKNLPTGRKVTKKIICYIAGTISELFETPPQFGHAKAMASTGEETARAKRDALKAAGASVAESFAEFVGMVKDIDSNQDENRSTSSEKSGTIDHMDELSNRRSALIATSISKDVNGEPQLIGENLLDLAKNNSFGFIVASLFLGKKIKSKELEEFVDFVLRLLVDHGPYVSGALNTIIASRAGRDLPSSLSAGILTIGPRFGGAINKAALNWINGVLSGKEAAEFVEEFASRKEYISGIGHKKYRIDMPDPRVAELLTFSEKLTKKRFTEFAQSIQKITTAKKGNLILNVDGAIAAILLDILSEKEGYSDEELKKLTEIEFFNALFVLSRSVGFISHFMDQKRLDEGLFRLDDDLVAEAHCE